MENSTDITARLETAKRLRDIATKKHEALNNKMFRELQVIRDLHEPSIKPVKEALVTFEDEIRDLNKTLKTALINENWQEARGRGEINEFYVMSLMLFIDADDYWLKEVKHKQTLANGIDIWMIEHDGTQPYKFYTAFHKGQLVGTSYRHTARHAGDDTEPYSFIGQFDDLLTYEKLYKYSDEPVIMHATFQMWVRELKKIKADNIETIEMTDETVHEIECGVNDYWYYYGWNDKQKAKA